MFNTLHFHYDIYGSYRKGPDGADRPLALLAHQCNASGFALYTSRCRGNRTDVECVSVTRLLGPVEQDLYNEDGSPPTLMFQLAMPQFEWTGNMLTVEGIEIPNLSWAGMLVPPYDDDFVRDPLVAWLRNDEWPLITFTDFQDRNRQRVSFYHHGSLNDSLALSPGNLNLRSLACSEVAVGHCVILNDFDRPCNKLVAVITKIENGRVIARYLSNRTMMQECHALIDGVTPISQFGLSVITDGLFFWCAINPTATPTATYPNGEKREWQAEDSELHERATVAIDYAEAL